MWTGVSYVHTTVVTGQTFWNAAFKRLKRKSTPRHFRLSPRQWSISSWHCHELDWERYTHKQTISTWTPLVADQTLTSPSREADAMWQASLENATARTEVRCPRRTWHTQWTGVKWQASNTSQGKKYGANYIWGDIFDGVYVPRTYSHARWELLRAIQVSVVVSLGICVTSVKRYKFPLLILTAMFSLFSFLFFYFLTD